ncbi:hypothetical protein [Clostridium taeniosporum]|uniref:DUF3794 domain-containing protein n=1 Tax=Clostridium taeniosporum TaxID=394958 RepID=A0A1D7XL31_9CLOT|nr:hypothetical protein [Clostridium taeniosporum]AOR24034.1 hypothetical protein BGI42_09955 [Clostridium taeniosporum]
MENSLNTHSIKYIGISSPYKYSTSNFKLFNVFHLAKIKIKDYHIENIIQIKSDINILNHNIIKTPKGTSCEGCIFTGNKLFFTGNIDFSIQYVLNNDLNKICIYKSREFFVESIQLPEYFSCNSNITLSTNIIDIDCTQLDSSKIYLTFTLYVEANL